MRDYVRCFYTIDSSPIVLFQALSHYFFKTKPEADSFVDSYAGSSPGGGTLTPAAPVWWRFNQNFLVGWLNSAFVQNLDPGGGAYLESPRKLGVNSATEKRVAVPSGDFTAKKSDFSGADTLYAFIATLQQLVINLKKQKMLREAEIIQYALNKITTLAWSITQAAQYLRDNLPQIFPVVKVG
jgi:hypothetical protein